MYGKIKVTWYNPCLLIGYGPYKRPSLVGSKSTSGFAEFSEYLIASRSAEQLLKNLLMDFVSISGLHGMTEQKIK